MRAAVTTDDHRFEVVDLPDPTPEPHQLVIRVASCGVCGSDIKAQPFAPAGLVMGHEFGGEVVAVGSRTDNCRVGSNIATASDFVWGVPVLQSRFGIALRGCELHRDGSRRRFRRVRCRPRMPQLSASSRTTHVLPGIGGTIRGWAARRAQRRDQSG
jgi:NADPH:quinone reductase-like Zn-dependent oxidoreductase